MIPFRVFDRENKQTWIVLNYQPSDGKYLISTQTDDEHDNMLRLVTPEQVTQCIFVDFMDDGLVE